MQLIPSFSLLFTFYSKVISLEMPETYETSHHLDAMFVICCWFGFLPAVITPCLVFSLFMNE